MIKYPHVKIPYAETIFNRLFRLELGPGTNHISLFHNSEGVPPTLCAYIFPGRFKKNHGLIGCRLQTINDDGEFSELWEDFLSTFALAEYIISWIFDPVTGLAMYRADDKRLNELFGDFIRQEEEKFPMYEGCPAMENFRKK